MGLVNSEKKGGFSVLGARNPLRHKIVAAGMIARKEGSPHEYYHHRD
jgi:hypothetical protein